MEDDIKKRMQEIAQSYFDPTKLSFGDVRKRLLPIWMHEMRRKRTEDNLDDIYENSYECSWQKNYVTNKHLPDGDMEKCHNSVFCSMGDWCTQISDWLTNDRYDDLHYWYDDNIRAGEIRTILFRHYSVFYLLVSEIITDLGDLAAILLNEDGKDLSFQDLKKAQKELAYNSTDEENNDIIYLMNYINSTHKHKIGIGKSKGDGHEFNKLHIKNHHNAFAFLDNNESNGPNDILVHEIYFILRTIFFAYQKVDYFLKDNSHKLKRFELPNKVVFKMIDEEEVE